MSIKLILTSVAVAVFGAIVVHAAEPEWQVVATLLHPRSECKAFPISSDEILIVGGVAGNFPTAACEIFNVRTHAVVEGPSMNIARHSFAFAQLPDSSILVAGGNSLYGFGGTSDLVEIFDVKSRTWSVLGRMSTPRMQAVALMVGRDSVLIVGGRPSATGDGMRSVDVVDLRTRTISVGAPYPFETTLGVHLVRASGLPIAFGGRKSGPLSPRSDRVYAYNRTMGRWDEYGRLLRKTYIPTIAETSGGELFMSGGALVESYDGRTDQLMGDYAVYDPDESAFRVVAMMSEPRILHSMIELQDGRVLIIGGQNGQSEALGSCEVYSPEDGTLEAFSALNEPRTWFDAWTSWIGGTAVQFVVGGRTGTTEVTTIEELRVCPEVAVPTEIVLAEGTLHIAGRAAMVQDSLELTQASVFRVGAAWLERPGSVATEFSYDVTAHFMEGTDGGEADGSLPGADGLCLVIQASGPDVTGNSGRGIGYNGLRRAIAIEVDTYRNHECADPDGNHVAVQSNGTGTVHSTHGGVETLGITSDIPLIVADGRPYYLRYAYTANKLDVFLSESPSLGAPVLTVVNLDIASLLQIKPTERVWVGLTASTGSARERHVVSRWAESGCNGAIMSVLGGGVVDHSIGGRQGAPPVSLMSHHTGTTELDLGGHYGVDGRVIVSDVSGSIHASQRFDASTQTLVLSSDALSAGMYYVVVQSSRGSSTVAWRIVR